MIADLPTLNFEPRAWREWITLDPETDGMTSINGDPLAIAGSDFMLALLQASETLGDQVPGGWLYEVGVDWGQRHCLELERVVQVDRGHPVQVSAMALPIFISRLNQSLAELGLGKVEVIEEQGHAFVVVQSSPVAVAVKEAHHPICHLYAGFLAGVFGQAAQIDLACIEIGCQAVGEGQCRFFIGSQIKIDLVASWLKSGKTMVEIRYHLGEQLGATAQ
ncbi:MAG: hypothetical protein HY774_02320 [Acidobacteria bacterium]|nr:hypothetical protein [Acidobacteriota bacterium]